VFYGQGILNRKTKLYSLRFMFLNRRELHVYHTVYWYQGVLFDHFVSVKHGL